MKSIEKLYRILITKKSTFATSANVQDTTV